MDIGCYLVTEEKLEKALLPEELLLGLAKSLREKGKEEVHYANRSIVVEGIYIPAKGTKTSLMLLPNIEE